MTGTLTPDREAAQASFRSFTQRAIAPQAAEFDRLEAIPKALVSDLASQGYCGVGLPARVGGSGDPITLGLLHAEIGRASQSVRAVLTAHHMVAHAVMRWGTSQQHDRWVREFAAGRQLAAFCLSEPDVGSDARRVHLRAEPEGSGYVLHGEKIWTTAGRIADVFLVIADCASQAVALLVPRDTPGVIVRPRQGLLGTRASMVADLTFEHCAVPGDHLAGRVGFGLSHVAATALDVGRYSVAWGCSGLLDACLDASIRHARHRRQFDQALIDHQLVRRMISGMTADARATRLLVLHAGFLKAEGAPEAVLETVIAKYFAARAAARAARHAVQIHGASGCIDDTLVARCYRDAKVLEIIEGSNEMGEVGIAGWSAMDE